MKIVGRHCCNILILIALLMASCGIDSSEDGNSKLAQNWSKHGFTDHEQRFSPLNQIDDKNVDRLGLVWSFETRTHGS